MMVRLLVSSSVSLTAHVPGSSYIQSSFQGMCHRMPRVRTVDTRTHQKINHNLIGATFMTFSDYL